MAPLVSVIVPAYNCANTILPALFSVLRQTIESYEIIVIDDCSTDETYMAICQLAFKEPRINLYRNIKNLGVAETRNIGCSYAQGQYIAFLDSDDIWEESKLEIQLSAMERTNSDISYTSYYIGNTNSHKLYRVPKTIDYRSLLRENVIGCSTVMLRAEIMKKHQFVSSFFHEDYVLWLTLLKQGYRAIGIEEAMVYYRGGGRSSNKLQAARNRWAIYRKSERLSLVESLYYMLHYICRGIKKHYTHTPRNERVKSESCNCNL